MEVSAKSECKTPSDLWWKIEVFPLWKITLKLGSKVIYQRGKTSIFHQKSEGVLHSLFAGTSIRICRYYHQNLLQVIPSDLEGKNSIFFRRSFFPRYALGMPSFNNSVCLMTILEAKNLIDLVNSAALRPSEFIFLVSLLLS